MSAQASAQEVLVRRAERLSRASSAMRDPARTVELLCFHIAGEAYALETRYTFSVMQRSRPAALPGIPSPFLGILGVQGEIVPVVDLAAVWGRTTSYTETTGAVVIGVDSPEFAIVVESLDQLIRVPEPELVAAPALEDRHHLVARLIRGMSLLDGGAMLVDPRFAVHPPDEQGGTS